MGDLKPFYCKNHIKALISKYDIDILTMHFEYTNWQVFAMPVCQYIDLCAGERINFIDKGRHLVE